ncbi:predicted protein [Phaeodactylum tricornutum CCAP 1055/1]|uniref:Uncharacterized protein n=1 Tax=Phaeodactylum tricornutum (strain CCAP 1055/1) TaxID=556484 RepID=B7G9L0_PHATC|nr:predicted protein [Phaeodactylum tricornutum CCAP 1055/1]EEC44461.1 predicted protein [Phaeodactylum tricornutum CCAP 1055/1]|eukprot:XP_002183792.1 predicted protein [Phaeodactylum tricornutum CCAP 1055/1]
MGATRCRTPIEERFFTNSYKSDFLVSTNKHLSLQSSLYHFIPTSLFHLFSCPVEAFAMKCRILITCLLVGSLVDAFTVSFPGSFQSTTAVFLKPKQGKQLEAAFNAAYTPNKDQVGINDAPVVPSVAEGNALHELRSSPTSAALSFVQRVFSLPSSMIKRHPHPKIEGLPTLPRESADSFHDDVILYPVVGFTFVRDAKDHCRALPKLPNPSCRIYASQEPLYGWFSPACTLNPFADDYCAKRKQNELKK